MANEGVQQQPKKRRKRLKRSHKYVDDPADLDDLQEASDEDEVNAEDDSRGSNSSSLFKNSTKVTVSSDGIVTCTVTTGHLLTNGSSSEAGTGSSTPTLGFTLSFPAVATVQSPAHKSVLCNVASQEATSSGLEEGRKTLLNHFNGGLTKNGKKEVVSAEAVPTSSVVDEPLALVAHDRRPSVTSAHVDEDYDC